LILGLLKEDIKMRCALVTIHNSNYEQLADLTWHRNRTLYAKRHGYAAIAKTDGFNSSIPIGFEKIVLLLELMKEGNYDIFHWSGTDTMITNFHIPLTEFAYPDYHVAIATDFNGINADSFVIRNTPEARAWLQMIMDLMPEYSNHEFFEQGVMMETHNKHKDIVKLVPQRFLNAYWMPIYYPGQGRDLRDKFGLSGQWHPGDFLLHAPGQPMSVRLSLFSQILPLVLQ
jgi:galactosyl transferase GMA12/MNN10 family